VGGFVPGLGQVADTLRAPHAIGRLAKVCNRWVYSRLPVLCLRPGYARALGLFITGITCYQLEYSRTCCLHGAPFSIEVYQGLIDRSGGSWMWVWSNDLRLKSSASSVCEVRAGRGISSAIDLTVFKVHFRRLTLKMYDKGGRVLFGLKHCP